MPLPPFAPPTLAELRTWYRLYGSTEDLRRLILEVQHARELLAHLQWQVHRTMRVAERADFGRLTGEDAPLRAAERVLSAELQRIGPIGGRGKPEHWRPTLRSMDDIFPFSYDPDDPEDAAALLIARAHQKRR